MITKLADGLLGALKTALAVVLLFFLLVGVARWSKANPGQFDKVVTSIGGAAVSVVVWACDGVTHLLGGPPSSGTTA